jgi:hypothetical protein
MARSSSTSKPEEVHVEQLKECDAAEIKECDAEIKESAKERLGIVSVNKKRVRYRKIKHGWYTLDWWTCYLDSCASYHTFFVKEFLRDVCKGSSTMNGSCNAGTVLLKQKGWYKNFQVWLNERGIVNLLSISMLDEAGYKVSMHTNQDWKVTTPKGAVIVFKRDTGVCKGMSYIDLREHQEGHIMLETVQKNMEGYTKREIEKAELSRTVQQRIGHPTSEYLKQIVSQRSLKNVPISSTDVANARSMFGPSVAGAKGWTSRRKTRGSLWKESLSQEISTH